MKSKGNIVVPYTLSEKDIQEVIIKAISIIKKCKNYYPFHYAANKANKPCSALDEQAVKYNMVGAVKAASKQLGYTDSYVFTFWLYAASNPFYPHDAISHRTAIKTLKKAIKLVRVK